jgi:hypothetical protein
LGHPYLTTSSNNLIGGQRTRATRALIERHGITIDQARELVGRWLFKRQNASRHLITRYGNRLGLLTFTSRLAGTEHLLAVARAGLAQLTVIREWAEKLISVEKRRLA